MFNPPMTGLAAGLLLAAMGCSPSQPVAMVPLGEPSAMRLPPPLEVETREVRPPRPDRGRGFHDPDAIPPGLPLLDRVELQDYVRDDGECIGFFKRVGVDEYAPFEFDLELETPDANADGTPVPRIFVPVEVRAPGREGEPDEVVIARYLCVVPMGEEVQPGAMKSREFQRAFEELREAGPPVGRDEGYWLYLKPPYRPASKDGRGDGSE